MRILCSGSCARRRRRRGTTARELVLSHRLELGAGEHAVRRRSPTMPISRAIASAVPAWSPVIIFTRMPAAWHSAIASIGLGPRRVDDAGDAEELEARPRRPRAPATSRPGAGRRPRPAPAALTAEARRSRASQRSRSSGSVDPSAARWRSQRSSSRSGAPLTRIARAPSGASSRVAMSLLADSNGTTATRRWLSAVAPALHGERDQRALGRLPDERATPSPSATTCASLQTAVTSTSASQRRGRVPASTGAPSRWISPSGRSRAPVTS